MKISVVKEFVTQAYLLFILAVFYTNVMAEEVERLKQITITSGEKASGLETENPLGYRIDKKTLGNIPGSGSDPLRAMQALPGVTVNDDSSADPAIRGSRPEDNSYFIDFLPVGYLFHAAGTVSVLNAQLVESFDYYPAAVGAEYAVGTGAVIDVKLRDPRNDAFTTTLDVSMLQAGVLIEGPVSENQSFYLAGRMSYMDLLLKDVVEDGEDGVDFVQFPRYTDYQGKYLWQLQDGSRLTAQATGASDKIELDLSADNKEAQHEPVLIGTHSNDTAYHNEGVVWEQTPGGASQTLAIGHMNMQTVAHSAAAGNWDVETDNWYAKGRWTYPLGTDHLLALGGQFSHFRVDYDIHFRDTGCTEFDVDCSVTEAEQLNSNARVKVNSEQLYIEENWYPNDRLAVTAGVSGQREDYLDEAFLEPRLRVEFSPQPNWIYSLGFGRYHQMPSLIQVEKIFGNPQLSHFDATHYVVGLKHIGMNGWEWKSEAYYKIMNNLVSSDPLTRYNNSGEGEAAGVELLLQKTRTDHWSGWLSLALSKARRTNTMTDETFPFEYDQPVVVNLVANYYINDKWDIGAKWWYHSGAPYTPIVGGIPDTQTEGRYRPVYGDINSNRMPNFHRLDLRLSRRFSDKTTAYVELINAYSRKNVSGYEYNIDYSDRDPIYQLPTLISFGISTSF